MVSQVISKCLWNEWLNISVVCVTLGVYCSCGGRRSDQSQVVKIVEHAWCVFLVSILRVHRPTSATRLWVLRRGIKWFSVCGSLSQTQCLPIEVKGPLTSDAIFIGFCPQGPEPMDPKTYAQGLSCCISRHTSSFLFFQKFTEYISHHISTLVLFAMASFVEWDRSSCLIKAFSSLFPQMFENNNFWKAQCTRIIAMLSNLWYTEEQTQISASHYS